MSSSNTNRTNTNNERLQETLSPALPNEKKQYNTALCEQGLYFIFSVAIAFSGGFLYGTITDANGPYFLTNQVEWKADK
jgi:hypothetical protein